jgi:photosystem II stability/assembly factor-like uncharacterized protein
MKKNLLSVFATALTLGAVAQQTPSPFWTTTLNTNFSNLAAGAVFLDAVDASTVWVIGNDGLAPSKFVNQYSKSTNGGTSFTSGTIYTDTNTYRIANMEGIDGNTAWVSAYLKAGQNMGAVHQTTNGGMTWTNMNAAGMYTNSLSFCNIVSFLTPSIGITMGDPVAGEYEIWRTTNGGAAWTKLPGASIANPLNSGEYGIVNVYEKQGTTNYWFGTNLNRVYRSTDAGLTWSVSAAMTSSLGGAVGVNDIAFTDANNGICTAFFGTPTSSTLTLWKTNDGGVTWTNIAPIDPSFGQSDICGIPGTTWFASAGSGAGNNVISYSTDNGITWNSWGGSNIQYITVDFVNSSTGFAGSFSSQLNAAQEGGFKYTGQPLGITKANYAPLATNVYPNPSTGIINLVLPVAKKGLEITVTDVLGKVVYNQNVTTVTTGENISINLQGQAKGVYMLNILGNGEKASKKIIIE